jgi:hypothetical protein
MAESTAELRREIKMMVDDFREALLPPSHDGRAPGRGD